MKTIFASIRKVPLMHDEIVQFAKYRCPINHPVAIFRKEAVLSVGGYPLLRRSQDYALWILMLKHGYKFANISEILFKMRCGNDFLKKRGIEHFKWEFELLKYQKSIKFINSFEYFKNMIMRFIVRTSPNFMKKILYALSRLLDLFKNRLNHPIIVYDTTNQCHSQRMPVVVMSPIRI